VAIKNRDVRDPVVREFRAFLALTANAEPFGYPVLAKRYHQKIGTFSSTASRAISYHVCERHWGFEAIVDHIQEATDAYRERIVGFDTHRTSNPGIGHRHASAAI